MSRNGKYRETEALVAQTVGRLVGLGCSLSIPIFILVAAAWIITRFMV